MAASSVIGLSPCELCHQVVDTAWQATDDPQQIKKICNACSECFFSSQNVKFTKRDFYAQPFQEGFLSTELRSDPTDAKAQFDLGLIFLDINSTPDEIKESIRLITLSADQGFNPARFTLGVVYSSGELIPKDIRLAVHYLTLAADDGDQTARCDLGNMYYEGKDVGSDIEECIKHYRIAADAGDAIAQYNLGVIFSNGKDIPADPLMALHYYKLAANSDHKGAKYNLGLLFLKGELVPQDTIKAVEYITYAAEKGHANALVTLARCYCEGLVVPQNFEEASRLLELSKLCAKSSVEVESVIRKRRAEMEFVLGTLHQNGARVPKSSQLAIKHYRKSASGGHVEAYHKIAEAYLSGDGVDMNIKEASRNYQLAEEQGLSLPLSTRIELSIKRNCNLL